MKKIFLSTLMLFSFNGFAASADYTCEMNRYKLSVFLTSDRSTHMFLTDIYDYSTIAFGYADVVKKVSGKTIYEFISSQPAPMKLSFNTQDVIDLPKMIEGSIDTRARGFILKEKMDCYKD